MIKAETIGFEKLFNAYRKQPNTIEKLVVVEMGLTLRRMDTVVSNIWGPHKKTGALEYGQHRDLQKKGTQVIGKQFNTAAHAPFVEFPTRPHVIRPRKASVLRFRVRGQLVFTRGPVNHPGTAAIPAFRQAMIRHGRGFHRRVAGKIKARFRS
jgi:hypothetical protein